MSVIDKYKNYANKIKNDYTFRDECETKCGALKRHRDVFHIDEGYKKYESYAKSIREGNYE